MPRILPPPDLAAEDTGLAIDHIGLVVHDIAGEVAAWRGEGFAVSDPVALMGEDTEGRARPLGQRSAHIVFDNGYIEISSPEPGSGNHLEPYLALGAGVRIVVIAVADAAAARAALVAVDAGVAQVRPASRDVVVDGKAARAGFRWFPLARDILPGVLSAVVEHENRDLVLHPRLRRHSNGLTRLAGIVATGRRSDLAPLPQSVTTLPDAPHLLLDPAEGPARITGVLVDDRRGTERFCCVAA